MGDLNTTTITGRLGRDPDLKVTQSGFAILSFSVAVGSKQKTAGGEYKDRVDWIDVKVLGKRAEGLGKFLAKGAFVAVEGRLQQETWEAKDGGKRSKLVLLADEVQLGPKGDGGSTRSHDRGTSSNEPDPGYEPPPDGGDDIPF